MKKQFLFFVFMKQWPYDRNIRLVLEKKQTVIDNFYTHNKRTLFETSSIMKRLVTTQI